MKVIHVTASYKPAYIYGGPIQSVGRLCEALTALSDKRLVVGDDVSGVNDLLIAGVLDSRKEILRCTKVDKRGTQDDKPSTQDDEYSAEDINHTEVKVITTTANGKKELNVKIGKPVLVEAVQVSYFKRWTKDHSHFSPGLLWGLRKEILRCSRNDNNIKISKLQSPNSQLIIHIHAWWNLVSVLSCFIAKWYKVPVVLSPRGMLTSYTLGNRNSISKNIIHKLLGKNLLQYCHIHATSEQEKADVLKIVRPKSIRVIPNLVSLSSKVSGRKYQEGGYFKLIFLSRIEEKKGLELLFNALTTADIPWKLTIAGSGEEQYLQSLKLLASNLKLSDSIDWVGQVSNKDKYTMMAAHDLLLLTSYNENFANVVIESLSVGTPVLISEYVGLADYVKDNTLGWVTSLETAEIKRNIISSYQNPHKRQRIRQTAPLIIRQDFNDDVLAKRYLEFYKTI